MLAFDADSLAAFLGVSDAENEDSGFASSTAFAVDAHQFIAMLVRSRVVRCSWIPPLVSVERIRRVESEGNDASRYGVSISLVDAAEGPRIAAKLPFDRLAMPRESKPGSILFRDNICFFLVCSNLFFLKSAFEGQQYI